VTPIVTPGPAASPCTLTLGFAYEPDGGNGNGFDGVQVVHFEDNDEDLCGTNASAQPTTVKFPSSVGPIAFSSDLLAGIALLGTPGQYTLAQDIFGGAVASLVPASGVYAINTAPPPAAPVPLASGEAPSPSPSPYAGPIIPNGTSIGVVESLDNPNSALALVAGPGAAPPGLLAVDELTNAPPANANFVPFVASTYTFKGTLVEPFSIISVFPNQISGNFPPVALIRGPSDLAVIGISVVGAGYQFDIEADNTSLGYGTGGALSGRGDVALDPDDSTRALIGGTTAGGLNSVELVTGLPTALNVSGTPLSIGTATTTINSIAIANDGTYAVVGTNQGIVVLSGVGGSALSIVKPFAPIGGSTVFSGLSYPNCAGGGATSTLSDIYSVGLSASNVPGSTTAYYLVALGTSSPPSNCASGYNASLVAVPFDTTTGALASPGPTPSPSASSSPAVSPTQFTQNNVIAPPTGADYLIVH